MIILAIPFLSIIQLLGTDTFLESFENPEYYVLLQQDDKYVIVQKSSHPDFNIKSGDALFYYNSEGKLIHSKIYQIHAASPINKYYTSDDEKQPIFERQIVGKIVKETDNSLINAISMNLWDISIHSLNIRSLVAD